MKVLFLTRDLPYPPTSGYKKRNFYLLEEMTARKIDVVCKEMMSIKGKEQKMPKAVSAFLSLFSTLPFSVRIRTSLKIKREIRRYLKENPVDVIICDSIFWSLNIPEFKGHKILYEHNIESVIVKRYVEMEQNIFKKSFACIEYLKLERFQKKMWKKFDSCIVCSALDKETMQEKAGKINVFVINNGVDTKHFKRDSYPVSKNTLVYTGEIGWYPNEDAIMYFVKEIFPLIKKSEPEVKFWIVGNNPSLKIRKLTEKDKSIIVTGFVDDVREFVGKACVYVAPLRIGSGTRLKILEALSMEKPVVSTSIGCEGLELETDKHLLIKDNPEEFARAVLSLLKNEGLRVSLGQNGRKLTQERYDWKIVFKDLNSIVKVRLK
ncbi:MAG: glycosyltransferase family 4 protein [Omnitrophica bacterium]|nr:glycosyltransferase family 4 protein [Candidatus Omnitrophota bacterium]